MSERSAGGQPRALGLPGRHTVAAFRSPAFRLVWLNSLGFHLTQSIQRFAYVWLVLELGGGSAAAGLVTFALGIPVVLIAMPAGSLSDRGDRRRFLIVSQAGAMLVSGATTVLIAIGSMTVPLAYAMAVGLGISTAIGQPVRSAIVPSLVERRDLMNAIVLVSVATNITLIVGPGLGGGLIAAWGMAGAFAFGTVVYALTLLVLIPLRLPAIARPADASEGGGIRAGMSFLARTPGIRALFLLLVASSLLLIGPYQAVIPQVARDKLGADALRASLLFTVLGVGTFVASVLLASVRRPATGRWFAAAMVLVGVTMAGTGLSPWYAVTAVLMLVWGVGGGFYMNLNQTLIQANTPLHLMGRVMSVHTVTLMGLGPIGALAGGYGAGLIGAPGWTVLCGFGLAAVTVVITLAQPTFRTMSSAGDDTEAGASDAERTGATSAPQDIQSFDPSEPGAVPGPVPGA